MTRVQPGAAQPPRPRGMKSPRRVEVLPGQSRSPGAVPSSGSAQEETAAICSYRPWLFHAYKIPGQQDLGVDRFYVTEIHNVGCKRCIISIGTAQHRAVGWWWPGSSVAQTFTGDLGSGTPPLKHLLRRRVAPFISSDAIGNDTAQCRRAQPTLAAWPSRVPAGTPAFQQRSRDFSSPPAPAASRASCPLAGPGAGETKLGNWLEEMGGVF